jgi:hypothetical protein
MKRYSLMLFALLFLFPFNTWAAAPGFLILDQSTNLVGVVNNNLKTINSLKIGPCPSAIVPIPENNGYLLMYQGREGMFGGFGTPGGLIYLDSELKLTAKKIVLPGIVIKDYYFKDSATWIFITINKDNAASPATVTVLNLKAGVTSQFDLDSLPTTWQFNSNHSQLALTTPFTTGSSNKQTVAQLVLIDLSTLKLKTFPISPNPGGIFFMNEGKVLVACGGFRVTFSFIFGSTNDNSDESLNACLHWINTDTGNEKITKLGYSPMVIIQDSTVPETFYTASIDSIKDKDPNGTFRKLTDGEIVAEVKFAAEPVKLLQTKQGTICLFAKDEFFLIDQKCSKILTEYKDIVDRLQLNDNESVGYLRVGNFIEIIDLTSGTQITKIKISSPLFGSLDFGNLLPSALPLVTGMKPPTDDKPVYASVNNQMILNRDSSRLYFPSQSEVKSIDLKTYQTISAIRCYQGKPYGIHLTPNEKYVVLATESEWTLLDPTQKKPVLQIPLSTGDYPPTTGYYSPDGNLLVIPSNSYLYLVDCQNGKLISTLRTDIKNAVITWLP